jgi:hypothetical protein
MTRPGGEMERLTQEPARPELAEVQASLRAAAESPPSFSALAQHRVRGRLQDSLQGAQRRRLRWLVVSLGGLLMVLSGVVGATMGPRLAPWLYGSGSDRGQREDQGKGKAQRHVHGPADRPVSEEPAAEDRGPKPAPLVVPAQSSREKPVRAHVPMAEPASVTAPRSSVHLAVDQPMIDRPASPPAASPSIRPMAMNTPSSTPRAIAVAEPLLQPSARSAPAEAPPMPSRSQPSPDPNQDDALLLGEAIRLLRVEGNPRAALAKLDRAGPALAKGAFAPELTVLRIEALLALGRRDSALLALDQLSMGHVPRANEWLVVRAELRGEAGRWRAAGQDFDRVLASGVDALGPDLGERALWGRSVASARLGDSKGARHGAEEYLRRFPHGRFLREAQKVAAPTP